MLGYSAGDVRMTQSNKTAIVRRLIPYIPQADNWGPNANGGQFGSANDTQNEENLLNFDPRIPMTSAETGVKYGSHFQQVSRAYTSVVSQGQRLRDNMHFNARNLAGTRKIFSPDAQSQYEMGYTLPIQAFAFVSSKLWNTPAGRNVAGKILSHPTLKKAQPANNIPVSMPWSNGGG